MNVERCAVPNCDNSATTGIPFPEQRELQEKWLKSLDIQNLVITPSSFVCLDHFGKDTALENALDELYIPTGSPEATALSQTCTIETEKESINSEALRVSVCRLCMNEDEVNKNIFDVIDDDITVCDALTCLIPDIKISQDDNLSKSVCGKCMDILKLFYQFRNTCLKSDLEQRNTQLKGTEKRKNEDNSVTDVKRFCANPKVTRPDSPSADLSVRVRSDLDKKFDRVEAELMKALEGKLTDEMKSADNIIIEIRSDDENEESRETPVTSSINQNVFRVGSNELKLPKGIKVSVNQAKVGICDAKDVQGMHDSEFCLVDNYLFEYRLCKGNIRHLKCLFTKCPAIAQQNMIEPGVFEDKVLVKVGHNHLVPSDVERKKQIFLHLMRRKMQSDKTLNFRSVYEEFCGKDPEIKRLVPLKTVINQICCQQMNSKSPTIFSFGQFYDLIENDELQKLHFTQSYTQFYQEKFATRDGAKAVVFANCDIIERISDSTIMYVDASFKIDTFENFQYHLVSILVWLTDSYYPIMFALINEKSQELYKLIFSYLHDTLAPKLRPAEIVTDYEASLYYSLGEIYLDSHIGGSVFYYTQNLYKKICSLHLSRELETNSCFRNIYHMILMLPLLPVNTIIDGLNNIELQASEMGQADLTKPVFDYVKSQWITKVTPDLFCVHRLENRINENVIAPFKKLRDFLMLSKGKMHKQQINIVSVVEKLIELEGFLSVVYSAPSKKSFARDLSSSQKKNVIRAWHFIESHPKININNFFTKVLGYIKCMENQLWIWGFYRYTGEANDELINAANFSIVNSNEDEDDHTYDQSSSYADFEYEEDAVVVDVVIDQKDGFLVKETQIQGQVEVEPHSNFQDAFME